MLAMYTRRLPLPSRSFFLFGPRGTGKTTWLRSHLPDATWFDLLRSTEYLQLLRDPGVFRQRVAALPRGRWVVVDEIQRLPALLDEIHSLMNENPKQHRFALTGSSARKLKRSNVNLLAGRTINRRFFPLTGGEMEYEFQLDDLLRFGCLPAIRSERSVRARMDVLEAYVANYVREEIQQEAAVKNLDSFSRFLEVAAIMNGQVANVAGLARDAAVSRPTVQGYFDVLIDTLIGIWLPAWKPRAKVKEASHPKFYFFDPGVVRGIAGRTHEPLGTEERGALLETLVLHELRAWISHANCGGELSYWRTPWGTEVDFVWSRGTRAVAIEVKASKTWRAEYSRGLQVLAEGKKIARCVGVYCGNDRLQHGAVRVLPVSDFMRELADGRILPRT
jgi:predicted AAA+ superfamily ATPase